MEHSIKERIGSQDFIDVAMIRSALDFWFSDSQHLRSPFPFYIRENLRDKATLKFLDWGKELSDKAKKEINDEILAEKFEEIIFELALKMVITEDEKLSILYPFMPRLGDLIKVKDKSGNLAESRIVDRQYLKKGDNAFLKVKMKNDDTSEEWETEFELPE